MRHSSIEWTLNTKLKRTSDRAARGPLPGPARGPRVGSQRAARRRTIGAGPRGALPAGAHRHHCLQDSGCSGPRKNITSDRGESHEVVRETRREREMRDGDRMSERVAKDDSLQEYRRLHATGRGSGTRGNYEAP